MKTPREMIVDIETAPIPRDELDAYIEKFPKKPHAKLYKPDKPSLYWTTGQVVCVGLMHEEDNPITICKGDEGDTLTEAHEILKAYTDQYITFNGQSFDFPYLTARAWKNLVPMRLPMSKYAKNHTDIFQILGGTYGSTKVSLQELAYHFGVDDDIHGHGSEIEALWNTKHFDEICKHCRGDIITTYRIYHGYIKRMYREV